MTWRDYHEETKRSIESLMERGAPWIGQTCLIPFVITLACRFSICRQIRSPLKFQHLS
jgi:hypothetical protein